MSKLTELLDLPSTVRIDEALRAKINIVMRLRGRNLAMQVREALRRGVDQEFGELGNEAIELLCRQMQATPAPPRKAEPMQANVGNRRQMKAVSA